METSVPVNGTALFGAMADPTHGPGLAGPPNKSSVQSEHPVSSPTVLYLSPTFLHKGLCSWVACVGGRQVAPTGSHVAGRNVAKFCSNFTFCGWRYYHGNIIFFHRFFVVMV